MNAQQKTQWRRQKHQTQRKRTAGNLAADAMARLLGTRRIPTGPQKYPKEGDQYFDLVCEELRTFENGHWTVGGHPV